MNFKSAVVLALTMSVTAICSTVAEASDTDWKLYGSSTLNGQRNLCFFDLKGAVKASDEHVRVWTKCLPKEDLDRLDIEKDYGGEVVRNAARKMVDRYVPPIALVEDMNFDQATEVATLEEAADIANIQPSARIFYELDCTTLVLRELSVDIVDVGGRSGSSNKASEWKYIAPETNGTRLMKILCEKS